MSKTKARFGLQPWLLAPLFAVCSSCTGVSSLPENSSGPADGVGASVGSGSATGAGSGTGTGGTGVSSKPVVPTTELDSGRVVLRRLNTAEYDNTMHDLLGTNQTLAQAFPSDDVADGFDTIGAALSFSELLAEDMESATGTLVDEVLARPTADPLRAKIMLCEPTTANAATCLPQILGAFMKNAFRRPATSAEVQDIVSLAGSIQQSSGDVMTGLKGAFKAVLLDPSFVYHVELGNPTSTAATPLNDYELASRLSYFAWSTMPDSQLMAAADAAKLAPVGSDFDTQVERVLSDPKAQAFINRFSSQWLSIQDVSLVAPSDTLYPTFDQSLLSSIAPETTLFFQSLVNDALPLKTLLLADFSFVNARLATEYGLPGGQTGFVKTSLKGTPRIGFLTQDTFLTVTSQPDRTSPVKRGNWVLEHLLCDPPPSPPPNVPMLVTPTPDSGLTVRAALEKHRSNPFCATCHTLMDPIGLGLENFDAIGAYRTQDNGQAVDASGTMPDGTMFSGAAQLANILASDPRYASCVAKQVLTYAIGRSFEADDGKAYAAGLGTPLAASGTWPQLLRAVIKSKAFLTRRGEAS
jgi:Protein of unknown function (DUF1592)/Protein of unknown function (DUF1588)/Protein of unknown function (DUF1587)/Protein of unknown function (DUF1595)/Protein of unknown function (DUF1585)